MTRNGEVAFVTGAYGFIGGHLTKRLLAEGAEVVILRRDRPAHSLIVLENDEPACSVALGDLSDHQSLLRVLNEYGVTTVFHLAAQAIVAVANRSPLSTFETNIRGTYNLLEAARLAPTVERVVVASSDKAYGQHEDLPYREDAKLQPTFPYDTSKAAADLVARSYAETYGLPVAVTRLANVYGGGDFNFSRLVPELARAIHAGQPPIIRSDGSPERDFVYVADAVDAYLTIADGLSDPANIGMAFNAGAGRPWPVLEIVRTMLDVAGSSLEPDIQGRGIPEGEIDRQYLDSTLIDLRLGWTPTWPLTEGLSATWEWYERALPGVLAPDLG
ncbi:MAG: NAD-dependent epimerase/dehydratase family protein [Solirubrobacterales bacterium]|nr:NAD-dependent epimerase/dehydratase family protein [Solirubrobacterales bacterium]